MKFTRREILEGLAVTGAGLMTGAQSILETPAQATEAASKGQAFAGQHRPKPLPYPAGKLKGLSEKLIQSHWENNYCGAVKALNAVETKLAALLADKDFPPYLYADAKREQLLRIGSLCLHEIYFANLGGNGKAAGEIVPALKHAFGSVDNWESEFRKTAMGLAGGSGWVLLSFNLHFGELSTNWAWDHMHGAPGAIPLLALDMYEHAFHLDYGASAGKYVDAFFSNVNWEDVNGRYAAAKKAQAALKA